MEDSLTLLGRTGAAACARACSELEDVVRDLAAAGASGEAQKVSNVVATLEDADQASVEWLARSIADATDALGAVLSGLHARPSPSKTNRATERLAGAMATLHPVRRALESTLAPAPAAAPHAPPKKRAAVEPGDDEGSSASVERRGQSRVTLDVDIGLRSETNFFAGFGDDVSEGGIFVATYDHLPIGTELTLSFVLPHGPQVIARGRVAWLREPSTFDSDLHPGMGVAFTELADDAVAAIRAYAEHREPMFYEG